MVASVARLFARAYQSGGTHSERLGPERLARRASASTYSARPSFAHIGASASTYSSSTSDPWRRGRRTGLRALTLDPLPLETLADRVARQGALNELDGVGWMIRLARRLEALHAMGVA